MVIEQTFEGKTDLMANKGVNIMKLELVITMNVLISKKEGEIMNQIQINEAYKQFNIPEMFIPNYTNAEEFSKNLKECSILRDVDTYSSSNSISLDISQNKNKQE